ncbi:hypothetical protein ONA92_21285 [Mycobacteroides salmoniphilum]|uniref:hypothetical protein n=1 Tax=Mycobacteroides salmoniphilum TaxID=404941 RepID=UPI00356AB766
MTEVSEAQDVMAEVAEKHRPYGLDCKCGRPINSDDDWSRHIAGEIDKALGGLTPIWADVVVDDDGFTYPHWNEWHDERRQAQKAVHDNPGTVLGAAFMSGWSEVSE